MIQERDENNIGSMERGGSDSASVFFQRTLSLEAQALAHAIINLSEQADAIGASCKLLRLRPGEVGHPRVIVSGVGKAGLIARKIAATLSSTDSPAIFLNPVDALHGDLGVIRPGDCGLLLSYSGETSELIRVACEMKRAGLVLIAITRSRRSRLGRLATICIELGDIIEACPNGLAPTSSTTVMLAVGDALALTVASERGFKPRDFARNHPAGYLGLRFRLVCEVMRTGASLVLVLAESTVRDAISMITAARTAAAVIVDKDKALMGIFTDGDLRRAILDNSDSLESRVMDYASIPCRSMAVSSTLADAIDMFREHRIEELPVVDDGIVVGLLCQKDIEIG